MTAAMLDAWFQSAHTTWVVRDGDEWRTRCNCGWMSTSHQSESAARAMPCESKAEQQRGRARLAAYLARQKSDESGLRRAG